MTIERDGSWDPIGSNLRDSLRDEFKLCGEECFYVDMVKLKDHSPIDWHDHSAVHTMYALAFGGYEQSHPWPNLLTDSSTLREVIRGEFVEQVDRFDQSFEDERDTFADRKAVIALRGINAFLEDRIARQ